MLSLSLSLSCHSWQPSPPAAPLKHTAWNCEPPPCHCKPPRPSSIKPILPLHQFPPSYLWFDSGGVGRSDFGCGGARHCRYGFGFAIATASMGLCEWDLWACWVVWLWILPLLSVGANTIIIEITQRETE